MLVDDETFLMATAHRAHQVPPTASFVWSEIGLDAGETPEHIIVRKEAERVAGAGEFWWGLGASLGVSVEVMARRNYMTRNTPLLIGVKYLHCSVAFRCPWTSRKVRARCHHSAVP